MQPKKFIMKHAAEIIHHETCSRNHLSRSMQQKSFIMKHAADIAAGRERQAFCDLMKRAARSKRQQG
jgi:hypothetical protein